MLSSSHAELLLRCQPRRAPQAETGAKPCPAPQAGTGAEPCQPRLAPQAGTGAEPCPAPQAGTGAKHSQAPPSTAKHRQAPPWRHEVPKEPRVLRRASPERRLASRSAEGATRSAVGAERGAEGGTAESHPAPQAGTGTKPRLAARRQLFRRVAQRRRSTGNGCRCTTRRGLRSLYEPPHSAEGRAMPSHRRATAELPPSHRRATASHRKSLRQCPGVTSHNTDNRLLLRLLLRQTAGL